MEQINPFEETESQKSHGALKEHYQKDLLAENAALKQLIGELESKMEWQREYIESQAATLHQHAERFLSQVELIGELVEALQTWTMIASSEEYPVSIAVTKELLAKASLQIER